ncbi:glyoxal reductase [Latilactobacillus curvatus CRL 705]|mgnify:FL=1|nr:glyoxal reductase [Latilactobacillus curvatus CRL 705]
MEDLYNEGKIRAIGVSNFMPHHLDALMKTAVIKPMVDQIEVHPG